MPRRLRIVVPDGVYHVLNRRVGRLTLFDDAADYTAFEKTLAEVFGEIPLRILAYCLMPNHWHLLVWPGDSRELSRFMQRLTVTHMRRWHAHRGTAGTGPVYQGRYKSFPVQDDRHLWVVGRYVERNALRCNLVRRAENWRWSSLWQRASDAPPAWLSAADAWPKPLPRNWSEMVNRPQTQAEEDTLRNSIKRGAPFGDKKWIGRTAKRQKLTSSLHDPWRPRKEIKGAQ